MRDVEDRNAKFAPQGLEQVDDRHAQRGIHHGDGLVGDDQFRFGQQRAGNGQPLQLATGKLVRITAGNLGKREADLTQGRLRRRLGLQPIAGAAEPVRR